MKKYESIYSEGKVSAAQYIAELVCFNRAAKLNIELPIYFWNAPQWKKFYTLQLIKANQLLKNFEESYIIKFIRQQRIWSLAPTWIVQALEKFVPDNLNEEFQTVEVVENPTFQRIKQTDMDFLDG
jgi:hypothetical protein